MTCTELQVKFFTKGKCCVAVGTIQQMEAPLVWSAAVVLTAGCAFKWIRLLGRGPRQDPEQAGELCIPQCLHQAYHLLTLQQHSLPEYGLTPR